MTTKRLQWQPIESAELREEIKKIVRTVAERIKRAPLDDNSFLANGAAGRCLLFGQLDRLYPDEGWDLAGHQCLVAVQKQLNSTGTPGLSLWTGLGGVLMAVQALSRNGTRYQNMMTSLLKTMIEAVQEQLSDLRGRLIDDLHLSHFDTVMGMTGIGRALLVFSDRQEVRMTLEDVLYYLVELCGEKEVNGRQIPTWCISSYNQSEEWMHELYPQGNFGLGLAHGITGPLALLSLALQQGIEVQGQRAAIRRTTEHVLKWHHSDGHGPVWPKRVSLEEWLSGEIDPVFTKQHRDGWCYGTPSIGRAIWLAGMVLEEREWQKLGEDAYRGIAGRTGTQFGLISPNVCHGWGGLLQLVQRMHADTGLQELSMIRGELVHLLLDNYSEEHPYGFVDLYTEDSQIVSNHSPNLLEGATGAALALLGLVTDEAPDWDAVLLIS